jgi:hypothetical protein
MITKVCKSFRQESRELTKMRIADTVEREDIFTQRQEIIDWLMGGDPAIRWQVMRDLLDEDEIPITTERNKIADIGWGAQFLSYQEPSGLWGGGIYSPKWISTTYTMQTLRRLGLSPENGQARKGCQLLLDQGFFQDGGINYAKSHKQSEACITGMVLSILAYFQYHDPRVDELVNHLLQRQMVDWGWNCQDYQGDAHSSFHTTIAVLEGLHEYQKMGKGLSMDVESSQMRGHEFLLQHRLFRSDRTGEIVNDRMLRMAFPPRWFYDFLRALDYFQDYFAWRSIQDFEFSDPESEGLFNKHAIDGRFSDGIELLKKKRKSEGKWNMMRGPSGRIYFEMERAGKPSRWNTLRGLRILKWWDGES